MSRKMKILIAYDGSECARAALGELTRAGLPEEAEAIVISVADAYLPHPSEDEAVFTAQPPFPAFVIEGVKRAPARLGGSKTGLLIGVAGVRTGSTTFPRLASAARSLRRFARLGHHQKGRRLGSRLDCRGNARLCAAQPIPARQRFAESALRSALFRAHRAGKRQSD